MIGDVLALNRVARNCHRRRFENGALRLDNVKLSFALDDEGNPSSCVQYGADNRFQDSRCVLPSNFCTL